MNNQAHILTLVKKIMTLNLKLLILLEYENIKIFLQKAMFQIGFKKFLLLKGKNIVPWTYFISDPKGEEILERFTKNNYKKQIKKSLELKR